MPRKRSRATRRLRLLRAARKRVGLLNKPAVQKRLAADLKRIDNDYARLRNRLAVGGIAKQQAKSTLKVMLKLRRDLSRAIGASEVIKQRALSAIDREIKRLEAQE